MTGTICGIDCGGCALQKSCGGCAETNGKPFGGECMIAACCRKEGFTHCGECAGEICHLKKQLIAQFNALGIGDMEPVTELYALNGSFVNLAYTLPGGQTVKFWDDNKIYLGSQLRKKNSDRCSGITADENYLLVCEYGVDGADAEIIAYKRRTV